ncbi:RNA polymerase factor sigma-54 [Alkalitalea saponilacus]|uniref:RNA polymerase, sigma 54 subunit, RpoN/SigL n=1 Tax=Alkalitalea saponilacus TaxID=889453 RepID=A0A1T5HT97_9BACT|nr:RNA polymerase factor sigma-54 [Alkalitalea saponilacus]ASB48941.1 RNA polymerase sigma-54 factor [Alkalitalea saponilacus]SKC23915.1 RNA polymerase, sigma 54 subunit, RpoN/SigL [Alkalitalea saponilacus]
MLKQSLQHKLLQKLSPLQIQVIKLLEIPTAQLEQRIKEELEVNPVLEYSKDSQNNSDDNYEDNNDAPAENEVEKDELSIDDYIREDDIPTYKLQSHNYSKDDKYEDIPFSTGTTFHEHLVAQLGLRIMTEHERMIAEYMIGNIDEDGYLRREVDEIIDDLAFSQNIEVDEKEALDILEVIHDFDPAGVGARDLQECLLLQIVKKDRSNPAIESAYNILKNHFEEFTRKHYDKILKRLHMEDAELKDAIDEILKLNPKPGSAYSNPMTKTVQHIIPDFMLEVEDGQLQLSLNSRNLPELRVSHTYSEMLTDYQANKKNQSKEQKEAVMFVKQKLDSAKWFIDAIRQRQNTLMTVMEAILDYQKEYFVEGDETRLRPMILKDIADVTQLDISTISRVSNSKYIQTHFGIFPLKYFFSEGLQTDSGEEVSTREIKKILEECIAAEDKRKPLTDDRLAQILKEKSYNIARRTVAKYREQLNIPVARLRKEL